MGTSKAGTAALAAHLHTYIHTYIHTYCYCYHSHERSLLCRGRYGEGAGLPSARAADPSALLHQEEVLQRRAIGWIHGATHAPLDTCSLHAGDAFFLLFQRAYAVLVQRLKAALPPLPDGKPPE